MNWTITTLKMGELTVEKSSLTYLHNIGEIVSIPVWAFAIEGNGMKILVDTGIHDQQWVEENVTSCQINSDEHIKNALKKGVGWDPEDVDIVINTHLHYDHCGNNSLFRNAKFVVQKKEWESAHHPIPSQKNIYLNILYDSVHISNWNFIDGDYELLPGINLILTPGHSEGHQSVLVRTNEGIVCISGDVFNLLENMENNIPAGILTSTKEIFQSMNKIREMSDFILPGHDPLINNFQKSRFPRMKKFI